MTEDNSIADRLELATRAGRIAIWEWDFRTDALSWSPILLEMLGIDPADFTGHASEFFTRVVPEDQPRVQAALDAHIKTGATYEVEVQMFTTDQRRLWVNAKGQAYFDDSGTATHMIGTAQDVTDRRALERHLLAAERIAQIGHWLLDLTTSSLTWSPEAFRIHGLDPSDPQPTVEEAFAFYHPDDVATVQQAFSELLETGKLRAVDARLRLRDGSIRHVHVDGMASHAVDGKPTELFGVVHDRTEMVKQAEQLRHSRRLETIGQLVGGVAHDFNNLLAVIDGNLDFLLEDEERRSLPADERMEIVTGAISATRRGTELTRSLLAFARRSHLKPQVVDVNRLVRETERWLGRALPASIDVRLRLSAGHLVARLDPTRLQSALVNVVVNARDAMPDGGTVTIETELAEVSGKEGEGAPGRYVTLSVTDTGTGIPEELLPRVFEPFVTSKEVGEGSGLGLSMVQGFVTQSGGFVRIASTPGEGTRVALYFPAADAAEAPDAVEGASDAPEPASDVSGRILVAEDQHDVLNVVVRTLRRAGYEVDAASNGEAALGLLDEGREFDLLLTDVVMPGRVSGPALAERCRQSHPELKVVFMSGYAGDTSDPDSAPPEGYVLLTKPIPRPELLATVRELLTPG